MKALEQAQEWLDYWLSEGADSEMLGWKIDEQIAELARSIGTFPDETDTALGIRIPALSIYIKAKQQLREYLAASIIKEEESITLQGVLLDYAQTVGTLLTEDSHTNMSPSMYLQEFVGNAFTPTKEVARQFLLGFYTEETTEAEMAKIVWPENEAKKLDGSIQ